MSLLCRASSDDKIHGNIGLLLWNYSFAEFQFDGWWLILPFMLDHVQNHSCFFNVWSKWRWFHFHARNGSIHEFIFWGLLCLRSNHEAKICWRLSCWSWSCDSLALLPIRRQGSRWEDIFWWGEWINSGWWVGKLIDKNICFVWIIFSVLLCFALVCLAGYFSSNRGMRQMIRLAVKFFLISLFFFSLSLSLFLHTTRKYK